MRLDIIVPQFNQARMTLRLIESTRQTYRNHRFIIVDNGSDRDELRLVEDVLEDTDVLVRFEENLGFAKGVNAGLRLATAPFVAIQNNDTIMYPEGFTRLIAHASFTGIGAVGPLCNTSADSVQRMGNWDLVAAVENEPEPWRALVEQFSGHSREIDRLAMFCTVLPLLTLETVGLLSEDFGLAYGEDDDYFNRVGQAGLRCLMALDVYVYHNQRTTTRAVLGEEGIAEAMRQGRETLIEKWGCA